MPFGMGPLGWAYLGYWHPWYGAVAPHGRPGFYPYWSPWGPLPKEQEVAMLNDQASMLEQELGQVRTRLEELQK
jgi:hypothetical protein